MATEKSEQEIQELEKFDQEAFMSDGSPNVDTDNDDPGKGDPGPAGDPPKKDDAPPATQEDSIDAYWDTVKEEFNDIEIPDEVKTKDVDPKVRAKALVDLLKGKISKPQQTDDPLINEYLEAKSKEGFKAEDFFQRKFFRQNLQNVPDDQLLISMYKRKSDSKNLGWTDEQIEAHVSAMSPIQRNEKAEEIRQAITQHEEKAYETHRQQEIEKMKKELPELQKAVKAQVDEFINEIKGQSTIGGFKFDEAERAEFIDKLPAFTEKKLVTLPNGEQEALSEADMLLTEILSDPKASMRMLAYLYLVKNGKMEGYSTKIVEVTKQKMTDKLDRSPEKQVGSPRTKEFNRDDFMDGLSKRPG